MSMIKTVFAGIGRFFADQWQQYTPTGQLLFVMALIAIAVDAGISFRYGESISGLHAAGFALVAIAFAVLPDIMAREFDKGSKLSGAIIGLALVPLAVVAYQSHIGYGAGQRMQDMQQTGFHQAKLEAQKESVKSEAANLDMWRGQLAELKARNKQHADKNKGWLVTVDPVAMQSQLDAMDTKIKNEAARVRCAQKCEELKTQRANLAAMIADIKQENDLTIRIDATQRIIDTKVATVAATGYRSSNVVNQNTAVGDLLNLVGGFQLAAQTVNLLTTGSTSLAFMILAPICFFGAGRNRKPQYMAKRNADEPAHEAPRQDIAVHAPQHQEAPTFALHKATVGEANRARVEALLARLPGRIEARAA